jgi:arylsulfatase A-like enzyme
MGQLALHGDVFLDRYRREGPAIAAVVFYGSDALSHAYWKFHEPEAYPDVSPEDVRLYGDSIREYYRRFDQFLGRLMDAVGPDTTVVIVSDHGFHAAHDQLLSVHTSALLDLAGGHDVFTAQAIGRKVYLTHRRAGTPEAAADVTRVAATLAGLRAGTSQLLDLTQTPGARLTVELRRTATREPADAAISGGARPMRLDALLTRTTWSGSHDNAGILLARGPNIRQNLRGTDGHVLDVAPTLLTVLGYPVAADMDGRVLYELLVDPPAYAAVASYDDAIPRRRPTDGPDNALEERLRTLGYVR